MQNQQPIDLYLIRHGKTEDNIRKVISGCDANPELTQEGVENSKKLTGIYQAILEKESIKSPQIVTTSRIRAKETVAAITNSDNFIIDDGFGERKSGKWVGVLTERLFKELKDYDASGGENIEQHKARIAPTLDKWVEKAKQSPVFIVSHAGTTRRIAGLLTKNGDVEIENSAIHRARSLDGGKTWDIKRLSLDKGNIVESPLRELEKSSTTTKLEDILKDNNGNFSLSENKTGKFIFTITPRKPAGFTETDNTYKSEPLYIGKLADDLGRLLIGEDYVSTKTVKKDDRSVTVTLSPMQAEILQEFAKFKKIEIPAKDREFSLAR